MLCPYCGRMDAIAASFDKNGAVYQHRTGQRCGPEAVRKDGEFEKASLAIGSKETEDA